MTLLLASERSLAASFTVSPVSQVLNWYVTARQKRAHKRALISLLAMEDHRLADVGLTRQSVQQALQATKNPPRA